MEVILVKPLRKGGKSLGKIGDLIKVKDGFARNFLIPQEYAIRANANNKRLIEEQKHSLEQKNAQEKVLAEQYIQKINGKQIIFVRQSSDDGKLFGSVNNKEVAKELSNVLGHPVNPSCVLLDHAIKFLGVSVVEVMLHPDVVGTVVVAIGRSESEAQDALVKHANSVDPSEAA
jgi:large subunit ribosomal protein L9